MKSTLVLLSLLLGSSAFAEVNHPCKKAVLRQAKEQLAGQIFVSGITAEKVEPRGDELIVFTLKVSSTTRSGNTKITELYEAKTDSSCHLSGTVDLVPDSQIVDEH